MSNSELQWVRSIYGKKPDGKKWYHYIPDKGINSVIANWHYNKPDREQSVASPSQLLACPRALWLNKHGVKQTNPVRWGMKQRMMLGRVLENTIAMQLKDQGKLLWHWQDDDGIEVEKFDIYEGTVSHFQGVPDLLLDLDGIPTISDAKTSRSDSYGFVPISSNSIWEDWGWYKYKIQVTAYYMLCHANRQWFDDRDLPLPQQCHLFSYALDDGVVRREYTWKPTEADKNAVTEYAIRYNTALNSVECPDCVCHLSNDNFDVKFCRYGEVQEGDKVATSCCDDSLIKEAKKG